MINRDRFVLSRFEGLKEALEIGTRNAVETVSKVGGTTKTLRSRFLLWERNLDLRFG
jgi:hypothetical protein